MTLPDNSSDFPNKFVAEHAGERVITAQQFQIRAADAGKPDADEGFAGFGGSGDITQGKGLVFKPEGLHGKTFLNQWVAAMCALTPLPGAFSPKLPLEHVDREMDHGRAAMRAGARRGAGFQVCQQGALFLRRKDLTGLDRQALADPPGNFGFDLVLQRGFVFLEILHQGTQSRGRIAAGKKGRHGAHLEAVLPERFDMETEMKQNR